MSEIFYLYTIVTSKKSYKSKGLINTGSKILYLKFYIDVLKSRDLCFHLEDKLFNEMDVYSINRFTHKKRRE